MTLTVGLAVDRGAVLVGIAVTSGALALVAWADGALRRARGRRRAFRRAREQRSRPGAR